MTNKFSNAVKFTTALATVLAISPAAVFAANIDLVPTTGFGQTVGAFRAQGLLRLGINLVLAVSGLITFFFLLVGGVQWIMAGGDKEGTEKARKRITASLVGLAIVFSTYALAFLIGQVFGLPNILSIEIPTYSN